MTEFLCKSYINLCKYAHVLFKFRFLCNGHYISFVLVSLLCLLCWFIIVGQSDPVILRQFPLTGNGGKFDENDGVACGGDLK